MRADEPAPRNTRLYVISEGFVSVSDFTPSSDIFHNVIIKTALAGTALAGDTSPDFSVPVSVVVWTTESTTLKIDSCSQI